MEDIVRVNKNHRRSSAVIYNGVVFLGGQTCDDKTLDIRGQTIETLRKIDMFLLDAGTDKSRLLTAQIWLKNIYGDFHAMNEVWDGWVDPAAPPTRATVQGNMAKLGTLIEIVVTAAIPTKGQ